ncbi:MAG: SDR family NAD(P)-dependent oxidoreductase, partial [Miltoncostaeaceae bacterium]
MDIQRAQALVIGATGGFGSEVARSLAARGARVAVHGRDADRRASLAQEIEAPQIDGDLTAPGGPDAVVDEAARALGGLDIVVMSAGGVA